MVFKSGFRKVITIGGVVSVVCIIASLNNPQNTSTCLILGGLCILAAALVNLLYNNDNA